MEKKSRRRRRPALSCLECRRRKIKCDRNDPCAHCVAAKTKCAFRVYRDEPLAQTQGQRAQDSPGGSSPAPSPSVPSAPGYVQQSHTVMPSMGHLNSPPRFWAAAAGASAAAKRGGGPNTLENHDARPVQPPQDAAPALWDLLERLRSLEASSISGSIRGRSFDTSREIGVRQCGLQGDQVVFDKTRMLRYSHWLGVNKEV